MSTYLQPGAGFCPASGRRAAVEKYLKMAKVRTCSKAADTLGVEIFWGQLLRFLLIFASTPEYPDLLAALDLGPELECTTNINPLKHCPFIRISCLVRA